MLEFPNQIYCLTCLACCLLLIKLRRNLKFERKKIIYRFEKKLSELIKKNLKDP